MGSRVYYWRNALVPLRLGNRGADTLWWRKIRRGGSVHDNEPHPSVIYRPLYTGGNHVHLVEHLGLDTSTHLIKRVIGMNRKGWKLFLSHAGREGGCYRRNTAQWAHRRLSVAGQPVLGVGVDGFCGCGAAWGLAGLIYRQRGDMCRGYSQSSLVGAKTATLLLPAHLESRLSGSAECLPPSLLPSPHPHPSIHPSIPLPQLLCPPP